MAPASPSVLISASDRFSLPAGGARTTVLTLRGQPVKVLATPYDMSMTSNTSRLSRRSFVENSTLAFGLLGSLGAANGYGAESTSPSRVSGAGHIDARQYGTKGDGTTDDTKALQAALEDAKANGPICQLPPGLYRLNGALTVPPGVALCGASGGVPHSEHPIGTVLLAIGGRGQAEGEPLITLKSNAVVRNLTIHYPEQTLPDVAPTPGPSVRMVSYARCWT
jgi:Pectate lyase superfamily protein